MDLLHIIVLSLIQGLTEFLPISSSAHLLLPSELLGWPDQGLAFDVAVHVGSLSAVLLYFRRDVLALTRDWCISISHHRQSHNSRLAWCVIVGTLPAALMGFVFHDLVEQQLRSMWVVAMATIFFALVLAWADIRGRRQRDLLELTLYMALIIGLAQALALIPGTSRSGITITAALLLGFQRQSAARLSFLLSIPLIAMSGLYKALGLIGSDVIVMDMLLGASFSALSALLCIHCFLKVIDRIGMLPFVLYRLLLGGVLVWMLLL